MGAKAAPMGPADQGERGAGPSHSARDGGGEGKVEWDSVFPRTLVSFPMWKIKGMN